MSNSGFGKNYLGEFRLHWSTLLGTFLGLGLGSALNHYMLNLFGPALLEAFQWEKSQFALIGTLSIVALFVVPLAGRFVDWAGPRVAAMVGFTAVPLSFLAFSMMSGNIYEFYAITLFKTVFGVLTTTLVFCRVVIERFDIARGLALSLLMTSAPLVGAIAVPIMGEVIDSHGWRVGYQVLAAASALGGVAAILLMGRSKPGPQAPRVSRNIDSEKHLSRETLLTLVRQPVFLLLVIGMFMVNLPQIIVSSQLKLVLYESGAASRFATLLISVYAVSVIVGRFLSGLALDRIKPHTVALWTLGLPAIGFVALASTLDASWVLFGAVALVGLAQGAEGDIGAYLTSKKFSLENYSFVYGFLIAAIGGGVSVGSLILGYTLHITDSFNTFLIISAVATLIGALLFFLTGRYHREPEQVSRLPEASARD